MARAVGGNVFITNYDGNRRTARLLTTTIHHRCGYDLKGIYSLEEYYVRNLSNYYEALSIGPSHNYYIGRADADISSFVEYFCKGMADACSKVLAAVKTLGASRQQPPTLLRTLRPLQRQALGLFSQTNIITTNELATYLGIAPRQARELCVRWVADGFLVIENPSNKGRTYKLAVKYKMGLGVGED
ncbi:MAG: hypothetical protein SGJ05_03740 [bacterium]|nr:hypothetical protein [bacterium]